jgi:hypothetical protein
MSILTFEDKHGGRRIRLWLEQLPTETSLPQADETRESSFDATSGMSFHSKVAIEIVRPYGPMFDYGLLGIKFAPGTSARLTLRSPVSHSHGPVSYREAIANRLDDVSVGGLDEYSDSIHAALLNLDSIHLPAGTISVTCMANGLVGSSARVFADLMRGSVRLLTTAEPPRSLDEAMHLLKY